MKKTILIILVLIISTFLFWWFQVRVSQLRTRCGIYAFNASQGVSSYRQNAYDYYYKACINEKGLK